jgi:hypothetical protein
MPEVPDPNIELTFDLTLSDYLAFQAWCVRENQVRWFLTYVFVLIAIQVISGIVDWLFFGEFESFAWFQWQWLISVGLVVYALINAVPFLVMYVVWILKKVPRRMLFLADEKGLMVTQADYEIRVPWSSLMYVNENRLAYFLRSKRRLVRLPKRELAQQQIALLEAKIRANVLTSVFKLVRP